MTKKNFKKMEKDVDKVMTVWYYRIRCRTEENIGRKEIQKKLLTSAKRCGNI